MQVFRIGARTSPLAIKQVEEVVRELKKFYPVFKADVIGIETCGDRDKITPISAMEGTDFFTREIEEALLRGDIDLAVHSAKDLPDEIPAGLCIAAITLSIDPYDALVSKDNLSLAALPRGAMIGTSSSGRKEQLKKYRPDFHLVDLRGTIEERLQRLETTEMEAVVIAACALKRLGLENKITERLPFEILKPHPLQGSLAVEARKEELEVIKLLSKIDKCRRFA